MVDDDVELATVISRWLKKKGHTVTHAATGVIALGFMEFASYDIVVLDWVMPEMDGHEVLRRYRHQGGSAAVIMLTGKNTVDDKLAGFDSGVDDYLTKPFDGRELVARVDALLKRPPASASKTISFGNLQLDSANHSVIRDGEQVVLTSREFALLEFLMRRSNQVIPSDLIISSVWPDNENAGDEALAACVRRLRQKIDVPDRDSLIRNVYGTGYGLFEAAREKK